MVEAISVSTYAPKSWDKKGGPEHEKFMHSFVTVNEYDLKTKHANMHGVQGDDRVPGGGREQAAKKDFIINCIVFGILALTCAVGVVSGACMPETATRAIARALPVAIVLFAIASFLPAPVQEPAVVIAVILLLSIALPGLYCTFAFSVGVALVFRRGRREVGLWMACLGILPLFLIVVSNVVWRM